MSKSNSIYRVEYESIVTYYLIPAHVKEKDRNEMLLKSFTSENNITCDDFKNNNGKIVFETSISVASFYDVGELEKLANRGSVENPLELKLLCFNEDY